MSWIISILITIYAIASIASFVICSENDLLDYSWKKYNIFEKIMVIILLINICIICIGLLCVITWGVHHVLMEIPQFKEFIIRMEWN